MQVVEVSVNHEDILPYFSTKIFDCLEIIQCSLVSLILRNLRHMILMDKDNEQGPWDKRSRFHIHCLCVNL